MHLEVTDAAFFNLSFIGIKVYLTLGSILTVFSRFIALSVRRLLKFFSIFAMME